MTKAAPLTLTTLALASLLALGCGGDGAGGGPNEPATLQLSQPALTMAEGGPVAHIAVSLDKAPTTPNDSLTVTVASAGRVDVGPTTLIFTGSNFATPQDLAVAAVQDADLVANVDTLTFTAAQAELGRVPVTIADDDVQSIEADVATLTLTETAKDTVHVHLGFQPAVPVTVTVAATGSITATPATLTFTPANYNTPQEVIVTGVHDNNLIENGGSLALTATGIAPGVTLPASVGDIDQQSIVLSVTTRTLGEGSTFTLQVHLAFMPGANTTVTAASGNPTSVAVFGTTSFAFTPANFATDQTVTITAPQDANLGDETVNITFSATGITNAILAVTTLDND